MRGRRTGRGRPARAVLTRNRAGSSPGAPVIMVNVVLRTTVERGGRRPVITRSFSDAVPVILDPVTYRMGGIGKRVAMQSMTSRIPAIGRPRVEISVQADANGLPYNPITAGAVPFMAFMPGPLLQPGDADWQACNWDVTRIGQFVFQCLVGEGGTIQLAHGGYYLWGKIIDTAAGEIPIEPCGRLFVD